MGYEQFGSTIVSRRDGNEWGYDKCDVQLTHLPHRFNRLAIGFYEKVIKVKADVAAFLINCFPSA